MRGMKNVIVEAAQITRIRNSSRWITNRIVMITSVFEIGDWRLGIGDWAERSRTPNHQSPISSTVLLRGLQPGDHQHAGVRPERAVGALGQVGSGRPVGPVVLVV